MIVLYTTLWVFIGGLFVIRYEAQLGKLFTAAPIAYSIALLWFDCMFVWWALDELFGAGEFARSAGFWVIAAAPAAGLYITVRVVKFTSRWIWRG